MHRKEHRERLHPLTCRCGEPPYTDPSPPLPSPCCCCCCTTTTGCLSPSLTGCSRARCVTTPPSLGMLNTASASAAGPTPANNSAAGKAARGPDPLSAAAWRAGCSSCSSPKNALMRTVGSESPGGGTSRSAYMFFCSRKRRKTSRAQPLLLLLLPAVLPVLLTLLLLGAGASSDHGVDSSSSSSSYCRCSTCRGSHTACAADASHSGKSRCTSEHAFVPGVAASDNAEVHHSLDSSTD
jgi:hypothetical protein